jgi:hypothetical protein
MLFPASCIDVYVDEAFSSSEPFSTSTTTSTTTIVDFDSFFFIPSRSFLPPTPLLEICLGHHFSCLAGWRLMADIRF